MDASSENESIYITLGVAFQEEAENTTSRWDSSMPILKRMFLEVLIESSSAKKSK